jgi:TetR/AcrR family transcriptional regulator, transcriptional repressor of aconitase
MPKVTEEHVDARRRQILAAALRCFAREGFHRTTMQDIFRESELSPGAVYTYFKGKDELIAAITMTIVGFIGEAATLLGAPLPDGRLRRPGEALSELIERYGAEPFGSAQERARVFPHLAAEQQRNPDLRAAARTSFDRLRGSFEQLARAAQERGELDRAIDPEAFGRVPIAMLHGMLFQLAVYGDDFDIDAYARTAARLVDGPREDAGA